MHNETKAWVGVISRSHVLRGVAGGFTQVCHGKRAPLARMCAGDVFVAYSPKTDMVDGEPLRAFTAIGHIGDGPVVQFDMGNGFVPFRRDVRWYKLAQEVTLDSLRSKLAFVRDAGWGMLARRGLFEITMDDSDLIARAMGFRPEL
jgi:EVE domain